MLVAHVYRVLIGRTVANSAASFRLKRQGREAVAEELIAVLEKVPLDHAQMTVSLLNEKWESPGDLEAGQPNAHEI